MKLFIMKKKSEKKGKEYTALYCSFKGKDLMLSIDTTLLLTLGDLKPSELDSLELNKKFEIKE